MPAVKFSPIFNGQVINSTGAPASGWKIYTYAGGSSTPLAAYTDSTGNVAQSNPIIINSLGFPTNGQLWLQNGLSYKLVLTDAADVVQKTEDNISGVNDTGSSVSQWQASGVNPTYVSASSFTLVGDQTSEFHVGRRLQFTTTGGTVYGTILTSAYTTLTTVTMTMDESSVLDAGLSAVNVSILSAAPLAVPFLPPKLSATDASKVLAVNERGDAFRLLDLSQPSAWINSSFRINQRGLTSLANGAYGHDRTYVLTQSGSVSYTTLTKPTDGIPFAGRFTQPDVTAKRFGFAQIMEAESAYAYCGLDFAFVPKVRCSSAAVIRVALLAHTGTADTLAKDVVNDWTSVVYSAGAFFKAGLTVVDVKSIACLANTWTDVPTWQNIPSSANNLIMFCWTEGAVPQNFTLDSSVIRAGRGRSASIWLPPDPAQELVRAQRFYEESGGAGVSYAASAGAIQRFYITYKAEKRAPATSITFAIVAGAGTAPGEAGHDRFGCNVGWSCASSGVEIRVTAKIDAEIGT